jgi:uncharacterized protein YdiU (UPF0061 family)
MFRLDTLPIEHAWTRLPASLWAAVAPRGLGEPRLVSSNPACAALIGLDPAQLQTSEFLALASGNAVPPGWRPVAQKYTGHQFGVYNPDLGDGRGLLLAEVRCPDGHRRDLHLKGAGQTPFSRGSDGRAVLRSSIREYLCSEAMHGLGIPTTRALCVVHGSDVVWREQPETCATVIRVAETHVRFGHFEYLHYSKQHDALRALADFVINEHFPEHTGKEDRHALLLRDVIARTARMIAQWQAAGFNHGVMNTDNMSILGVTFDYGPFAFFDEYDATYICNHSDHGGRYAFHRQPQVGLWNLNALAHAFSTLVPREQLVELLQGYEGILVATFTDEMRARLGLAVAAAGDADLIQEFLDLLHESHADYPTFLRALCDFRCGERADALRDNIVNRERFDRWALRYCERLAAENSNDSERAARMKRVNPKYVLRNWLLQVAIDKAKAGDHSGVDELLMVMQKPFDEWPQHAHLAAAPPDWGRRMEISCSS